MSQRHFDVKMLKMCKFESEILYYLLIYSLISIKMYGNHCIRKELYNDKNKAQRTQVTSLNLNNWSSQMLCSSSGLLKFKVSELLNHIVEANCGRLV